MRGARSQRGFTIVETMIVLAVSSAMFVSALSLISGQQAKTEFNQGIREIHSQIQDILNDVNTGYYVKNGDFHCDANGTDAPEISSGNTGQGQNYNCVFLGKVLQFRPDINPFVYVQYTIVGRNTKPNDSTNSPAASLAEAKPTAMACISNPCVVQETTTTLPYGFKVNRMEYVNGATTGYPGSVGFISNLCKLGGGSSTLTQPVDVIPIPGTSMNNTRSYAVGQINAMTNNCTNTTVTSASNTTAPMNPTGGVIIYFVGQGGARCGKITIGGAGNGQLISRLDIVNDVGVCN